MIIMSFSYHDSMKMPREGPCLGLLSIASVAVIQGLYHTSQLRKAFETANGGVPRVDPAIRCEIIEDAMAVIRAERNFLALRALAVLSEQDVQNTASHPVRPPPRSARTERGPHAAGQ
jgi:hypothetical protein